MGFSPGVFPTCTAGRRNGRGSKCAREGEGTTARSSRVRSPEVHALIFPLSIPFGRPSCRLGFSQGFGPIHVEDALSQSFLVYNNFLPQLTQNPNEQLGNKYALVINRSGSFFHEMLICLTLRTFIFEMISLFKENMFLFTRLSREPNNVYRVIINRGVGIHFSEKYVT